MRNKKIPLFVFIVMIIITLAMILIVYSQQNRIENRYYNNNENKALYIKQIQNNIDVKANEDTFFNVVIQRKNLEPGELGTADVWYPVIFITVIDEKDANIFTDSKRSEIASWGQSCTIGFNFSINSPSSYHVIIEVSKDLGFKYDWGCDKKEITIQIV